MTLSTNKITQILRDTDWSIRVQDKILSKVSRNDKNRTHNSTVPSLFV